MISKIYKQLIQFSIKTKKNKQPYQKMGRRPKKTFLQRRYTDGQEAHNKMLNITNVIISDAEDCKSKIQ